MLEIRQCDYFTRRLRSRQGQDDEDSPAGESFNTKSVEIAATKSLHDTLELAGFSSRRAPLLRVGHCDFGVASTGNFLEPV